jgi:hypothetical protein
MNKIIYVIGDVFENFKEVDGAVHYSEWADSVRKSTSSYPAVVCPGQGLTFEQQAYIDKINHQYIDVSDQWADEKKLATNKQTHKARCENILITTPEETSSGVYCSDLLLHADNEFLLDHTTGYHIQGMVFLEATRQIASAVTDMIRPSIGKYYVMHDIYAEYHNFAFPIETKVILKITENRFNDEGEEIFVINVEFLQNGKKVVATGGSFTATDKQKIIQKEQRLANITIQKSIRTLQKKLQPVPVLSSVVGG